MIFVQEKLDQWFGGMDCGLDESDVSKVGNVTLPCFAIDINLCIKYHHVHRTLIGGFYLFARSGYVCLFLILGNDGDYASNLL